jgi:Calcineurin-like phosphoesterase
MKRLFWMKRTLSVIGCLTFIMAATSVSAKPWGFGVISDTQWTIADDGKNPNTCAADIIKQIDAQFIAKHVKLVVHVGDMVNSGSQVNDYTRALYAQDLYNAGIGFYPLRGNHEAAHGDYLDSGADYKYAYPQIVPGPSAGINNNTPSAISTGIIPALDLSLNPPAEKTRIHTFAVGTHFSAPEAVNADTGGVSYAFQYKNATFMLLDQFASPDYYTSHIPEQQPWIDATLSDRPANTHAFVFTHKNILGGNHKDNIFGGQANGDDPGDGYGIDPETVLPDDQGSVVTVADKQEVENAFLASMQENGVKYVISGHDHHHYNSVVISPDQQSRVHQLITASDSSKFYTPSEPVSPNDIPVEQDLGFIGFYIFTVDGPRVTIDYYADDQDGWIATGTTPALHFAKKSTTGYSLNGIEKLVAQGASYAMADDTAKAATMGRGFKNTSMAILDGINAGTTATNYGKSTEKAVNTGWEPAEAGLASDILSLWGMADLGSEQTDTYVLQMSYDPRNAQPRHLGQGQFGLVARDAQGHWVNAVNMNFGGTPKFVKGSWENNSELGSYGIDPKTKTAWAVVNFNGEFAVTPFCGNHDGHRACRSAHR